MPYDDCNAAGGMTAYGWDHDPKRLAFQYARYKFVAKMFTGKKSVLEVGCSDAQGTRIVRQHVPYVTALDVDVEALMIADRLMGKDWPITFVAWDIRKAPYAGFDGVFCLDLFEHIAAKDSHDFLSNLRMCAPACIIGTPSKESQVYASEISKREHVNCLSGEELRAACRAHWSEVFMFGMNDEVVHTGFLPMAQYLLAVCVR